MPDLHQTLRSTDLDFLQRVARAWGFDLSTKSFAAALKEVESHLQDESLLHEILDALPENARTALDSLLAHQGRESWAIFIREFGELRTFGLARRTRENPDLRPISAVEVLWYRALIGRVFLNMTGEPQEYAYIPDELLALLQPAQSEADPIIPRPAAEAERKIQNLATDTILDDATEALAALRMNRPLESSHLPASATYRQFLLALLTQSSMIASGQLPEPDKVKEFLSASRGEALLTLYQVWQQSRGINDLRMLPGLTCDGNWNNDPFLPRRLLLGILSQLDPATWWSIPSLIAQIKTQTPDFQRPAGDYDSWFIRDEKTHAHLHGFENWEKVEGVLIRYLLAGPFHWLGIIDIARAEKNSSPLAFRISAGGSFLLKGLPCPSDNNENASVTVSSDGTLFISREVPRAIRYQLARFSEPLAGNKTENRYRITADSLRQAADQGLRPAQLIYLLQQAKVKNLPQTMVEALNRWEKYGTEVKMEPAVLLRLGSPDLLPILQKTPRVARCLAEVLSSQVILVKPGSVESLRQALAELGLLAEIKLDKGA